MNIKPLAGRFWRRAAFLTAAFALALQGTAWILFTRFEPIRPSVIYSLKGFGEWCLLLALIVWIIAAIRTVRNIPRSVLLTLLLLLVPSCCITGLFSGPPGETIDFQWEQAARWNAGVVGNAFLGYKRVHGRMPSSLSDLVSEGLVTSDQICDPADGKEFTYVGGDILNFETGIPSEIIVLYTHAVQERSGRTVVYGDSHNEFVSDSDLAKVFASSNAARAACKLPPLQLDGASVASQTR